MDLLDAFGSAALDELFRFLSTQLPMHGVGQRLVFERVLQSLDAFAEEQGIRLAVVMDEFQYILRLEKYKGGFEKDTFLGFWEGVTSGHCQPQSRTPIPAFVRDSRRYA